MTYDAVESADVDGDVELYSVGWRRGRSRRRVVVCEQRLLETRLGTVANRACVHAQSGDS